jgi:hypothetical protein
MPEAHAGGSRRSDSSRPPRGLINGAQKLATQKFLRTNESSAALDWSGRVRIKGNRRSFDFAPSKIIFWTSVAPPGLIGPIHAISQGCASLCSGLPWAFIDGSLQERGMRRHDRILIRIGGPQAHEHS